MKKYSKAVIFDMNGVIINDERYHQQSWIELFDRYNLSFTEDVYKKEVFGRTDFDTICFAFGKNLTKIQVNNLCDERDKIVMRLIGSKIPATDGVKELIKKLYQNSIPLAIATSSRRNYADFVTTTLDIKKYFISITTAEQIIRGKPDPEIYLLAAKKIKVLPNTCTAIEDSISGIKSAKAAGMYTVAITTTHDKVDLKFSDKIIDSFKHLEFSELNLP